MCIYTPMYTNYTCIQAYSYVQLHTVTYSYIQLYTVTYSYIQLYTVTYSYIQLHTYIDTCDIHTCIHTFIHKHSYK